MRGDDPWDSQRIAGGMGHIVSSNLPPSYQGPEPPEEIASALWWQWTSPANGRFVFDTHGSEFDTVLAVYSGRPGRLSEVSRSDDDGDVVTSAVTFEAVAGDTYYIEVESKNEGYGLIDLSWQELEPAPTERGGPTLFGLQAVPDVSFKDIPISINTGEKPQSKVWEHDGMWWAVLASTGVSPVGTWVWKLGDDGRWSPVLHISDATNVRGDAKRVGDVTHILLHGPSSELTSIEYVPGEERYKFWSERPVPVPVSLPGSETATIDVDSTGRMWLATDAAPNVHVYHSEQPYRTFLGPIALARNITSDDIAVVTALSGKIGVLWSNQTTRRFGFRTHTDGAPVGSWSADEVPAGSSALPVGGGMADDHLNVAVAADGTLYAAIKTEYEHPSYPVIGLLVRHPHGTWDSLLEVDRTGTRPIVLLNENDGTVHVAYPESTRRGDILSKTAYLHDINFQRPDTVISGLYNNPTSTRDNWTEDVPVLATSSGKASYSLLQPRPAAPGVRGVWSLDEGSGGVAGDGSGWGNDGVLRGSPAWVSGVEGSALRFDGGGDYVTVADDPVLDLDGPMTVAAWVRPERVATQYVVRKSVHDVSDGFELSLASSGRVFVRFNQASSKNTYRVDSTVSYPSDGQTWMHVAATYDGSRMRLYVDGVEQGSRSGPSSVGVNAADLAFGAASDGLNRLQGAIDEVRLYDRALTAQEINELGRVG